MKPCKPLFFIRNRLILLRKKNLIDVKKIAMRKIAMTIKFFLLALTSLVLTNCNTTDNPKVDSGINPELQTTEAQAMVEANNEFAISLFKEVAETEASENYMVSPLSVSMALGMVHNGTGGQTNSEFNDILGYPDVSFANDFNQSLIASLTASDAGATLNLANAIWVENGFPVEEEFISVNEEYYNAEVDNLDFASSDAVNMVNNWAYDRTNGKIEDIVDNFDDATVLFLANALYFKGTWKYRFDPNETIEDVPFYTDNGTENVEMMFMDNTNFSYFANDIFSSVLLPYKNDRYQMMVLLPHQNYNTEDISEELSVTNLENWLEAYTETKLTVQLPKFKMEYKNELNDELIELGIQSAFDSNADFSNINSNADLQISKVIHKTFIEVNEEGTEAAAVTGVEIVVTSAPPSFIANKPFLYLIRDSFTGSICFMGKVGRP